MEKVTLIANEDAKSPVSEAYRTIRTNIQFSQIAGKELKTILLTSATPNEGKSTTISNLGVVMAQAGNKVLLVDCDFRNPTQHKMFGVANKGVTNCISLGGNITDYIIESGIAGLQLLPSGPVAPNPSEILGSQAFIDMLANLKENYDYVLVDTPPIMPVTDACVVASRVDGVILILESGAISPQIAKEATTRLKQAKAHILGAVLNKVDVGAGHYGYGYGYYYYYGTDGEKEKRHQHHKE